MNCLVTGGTGFIGSHLVDHLLELKNKVIIIDNNASGNRENLKQHNKNKQLKIHEQNITENIQNIFDQETIDYIFHLAALPRVQFSIAYPAETHTVNVEGTFNLLNHARKNKVKRFIFSSSSSVYGDQNELPLHEGMVPQPMSPYALHKLIGEHYCTLFYKLYSIETISLRYFNVYGPRQNPSGEYANLIPKFIKIIKEKKQPTIFGNGEQTRDFTFVRDVVTANICAATTTNHECFGKAFNIGSGKDISVNNVFRKIREALNISTEAVHALPVTEPQHTRASLTRSSTLLNWKPTVPFEIGLQQCL